MFQLSFAVKQVGGKIVVTYAGGDAGAAEKAYEAARLDEKNEVVALFQTPIPRLTAYPENDAKAAKAEAKAVKEREAQVIEASRARIENDLKTAQAQLDAAQAEADKLTKPESAQAEADKLTAKK